VNTVEAIAQFGPLAVIVVPAVLWLAKRTGESEARERAAERARLDDAKAHAAEMKTMLTAAAERERALGAFAEQQAQVLRSMTTVAEELSDHLQTLRGGQPRPSEPRDPRPRRNT
jgi:nitrate reductase alpha subunit